LLQNCDFLIFGLLGNCNAFRPCFLTFFLQNLHVGSFPSMYSIDRNWSSIPWELGGRNLDSLRKIMQFSKLFHGNPMLFWWYGNAKTSGFSMSELFPFPTELYRKRPSKVTCLRSQDFQFIPRTELNRLPSKKTTSAPVCTRDLYLAFELETASGQLVDFSVC